MYLVKIIGKGIWKRKKERKSKASRKEVFFHSQEYALEEVHKVRKREHNMTVKENIRKCRYAPCTFSEEYATA